MYERVREFNKVWEKIILNNTISLVLCALIGWTKLNLRVERNLKVASLSSPLLPPCLSHCHHLLELLSLSFTFFVLFSTLLTVTVDSLIKEEWGEWKTHQKEDTCNNREGHEPPRHEFTLLEEHIDLSRVKGWCTVCWVWLKHLVVGACGSSSAINFSVGPHVPPNSRGDCVRHYHSDQNIQGL